MPAPEYQPLEFADRYYVQTAKDAIESLSHIAEEVASNEDEAITRRAVRDKVEDSGRIDFAYDPDGMILTVIGDGDGMTAAVMRDRLGRVGEAPQDHSKRGFFHRGIREVFLAMGGGTFTSIGKLEDGREVVSKAVFHTSPIGMTMEIEDEEPSAEQRSEIGLEGTGSRVDIPMRRFALKKPRLYEFGPLESQIKYCVGLRPVVTDPSRHVLLTYGSEPPRDLRFTYPDGEDLVAERDVEIRGEAGTLWVKVADKPIKGGGRGRRLRGSGVLVRGERAAYEVTVGEKIAGNPAMNRVYGELRLDGIERLQREADAEADDEAQLIYKTDRSGLNSENEFVEATYEFIDSTLGPLVAELDAGEDRRQFSPDMRRQLQKLARAINEVLKENPVGDVADGGGGTSKEAASDDDQPEPPAPPPPTPRVVPDGIGFAYARLFLEAGKTRTIEVWFDDRKIAEGTNVELGSRPDEVLHAATLSGDAVPAPGADGIAQLDLELRAGNSEGRHELEIAAGGYTATLPIHVRFPRASGFISQIVAEDTDWEAGSALWDPSTGVVRVFVGRPEFKDAARRANSDGEADEWKHPVYRQLVVESVREAALWPASVGRAEVEWDELPSEEREDSNAFFRLVQTEFQELDYLLRGKLHKVFAEA